MSAPNPTRADVETLIAQWTGDPCWDLEDTDGYEAYREELLAVRLVNERRWQRQEAERVQGRCAELGCTPQLLRYLESLERAIARLEEGRR